MYVYSLFIFIVIIFLCFQAVVLLVMYSEALVVIVRQKSHFRVTRALRPIFLIDCHYCGGIRRYERYYSYNGDHISRKCYEMRSFVYRTTFVFSVECR